MPNNRSGKYRLARLMRTILLALALGLAAATVYYANEVRIARQQTPDLISEALNRYGTELTLADLSPARKAMVLAIEDPTFLHHRGVDLTTPGAGMTTITQGLVKRLYFPDGFRPGIAKIRQTLIAQYALDALSSKEQQLLLFLNMSYLGNANDKPIDGFANAARHYFGKEFAALTDDEFLALLAMLISPNTLQPGTTAHAERMQRLHAYLVGDIQAASLLDVEYNGKQRGTPAEEVLMALLRLVTEANPT